jgi:hypothetical protein
MRMTRLFQGLLCFGGLLALLGGAAIAGINLFAPQVEILSRLELGYRQLMIAFAFLALFSVAAALIGRLSRPSRPEESPAPAPIPIALPAIPATPPTPVVARPAASNLAALYHEMKTYVDLEMWELALGKANAIMKEHPGTREAELVERNLGELRWKAEPKFVAAQAPITADQEKQMREKGLAAMYQHVKTYMDLEMWELARQKALAIMKSFPEAPESAELMKVYETIEKKARESAASSLVAKRED